MESRSASVSLNVRPLVDRVEKSQTDLCTKTPIVEDKDVLQSVDFKSVSIFNKLGKRKRQCELSNRSCSVALLLKNYDNFLRSGLLSRLLFHQDGEWVDFPKQVTKLVRKKFEMKYAIVEVEMLDSRFILDFMSMMKFDINTDTQKAIAWIDDAGSCFFHETQFVCHCDSYEKPIAQDINLHLQIEYDRPNGEMVSEHAVELKAFKKIRGEDSQNGYHSDNKSSDKMETGESGLGVGYGTSNLSFSNLDSTSMKVSRSLSMEYQCLGNDINITKVHEMFHKAMGCVSCPTVIEIEGCSGRLMENRLELFNTLAKHTEKFRGSYNVQYTWLPCARKDVCSILSYGLGIGGLPSISAYGYGVHLSSKNHAYTSIKRCDDDENGIRHMLLCRVVLGNVEPVHIGSGQSCPSSDQFDTGVDDVLDPRVHIVWEMNALTHILPEFVVSFKLTSRIEAGAFAAQMGSFEVSEAPTPQVGTWLHIGSSNASELNYHPGNYFNNVSQERTIAFGPSSRNIPKSPWMPFPVLFSAISKKVLPQTMQLVYHHYYMFKCKKTISRSEFVKRMRMIVGDTLLKSTITSLRSELRPPTCSPCATNLVVPKPEPEV